MKKKIFVTFAILGITVLSYAFPFTASCGKTVETSFGNLQTEKEITEYIMWLDSYLCSQTQKEEQVAEVQ